MEASGAANPFRTSSANDPSDEEINVYFKILKTVGFKVKRSETIDNLKKRLREIEGIAENLQEFFFAGNRLSNGQRLVDSGIHENSSIDLIVQNVVLMKIFVKIASNQKTFSVEARAQDRVQYVKSLIHAKEGFRPDQFTLVYDGKLLDDDRTLASLNMRNESTLYLIFCPKDVLSIFVKAPTGEIVKLEIKAQFTVRDIKEVIASMIGVPVIDQDLYFSGERLENCKTLAFYNIFEESALEIRPPSFQIFVKPWSGNSIIIDVFPFDTIENVKQKVSQKVMIPEKYQSLVFAGKRLEEHRDLASYKIQRHSTLNVVMTLLACKMSLMDIGRSERVSIRDLKATIKEKMGFTVKTVVYKLLALDDERTPSSYGISIYDELVYLF
ncbi:polyubiquitin-B-like [Tripterygium wilfordii]|uniref:polyubiquitin-B-like n=1 Tax=Tripterygium wilfordii TaxID=458696 RepID=UPI0018F860BF|nr:polyubiquitin-B-like [Tripterygium wilfordii]